MAKDKPLKLATKKHLARLERERRQTRMITIIALSLVAIVAGLLGFGILQETVLKSRQVVVSVNGQSVNLGEFQDRVRAQRQQYVDQYIQYYQLSQMFGIDPTTDPSISGTFNQIQSKLSDSTAIGQDVIDEITSELIIRQYAAKNGITISAKEVDKAIQEVFSYYPDGTPTPTLQSTPLAFSTLSATQLALVTPTTRPTLAPTKTPGSTEIATTSSPAGPTATATPVPSITPTATQYTLAGFEEEYQKVFKKYSDLGVSEVLFKKMFFERNLYRKEVSKLVTKDISRQQDQVWARHILVADEQAAKDIYSQLVKGMDFAVLAKEFSTDTSNKDKGGDLGWFGKGKMVTEFETAAFKLKIGEISQPVKTTFGWHIIQALGHEVRPLTDDEFNRQVDTFFNSWLEEQKTSAKIEISPIWTTNSPVSPNVQTAIDSMLASATAYFKTQSVNQTSPTP